MRFESSDRFEHVLIGIAERAHGHDISGDWPVLDLAQLHLAGATRWAVPAENGGGTPSAYELHLRYEQLASASVATALILTQRDAAVGLIDAAGESPHRSRLLNELANNEIWATVGIAQLTTSRQGAVPAVRAARVDRGYVLNGTIPWCTGLEHSDFVVSGASVDDGRQILVLLREGDAGARWGPPLKLVALNCTITGPVELKEVLIEDQWVLRHPTANALAGRRTSLTLGQTFIATGLAQSALNLIAGHDSDGARAAHERFANQLCELQAEIATLCQPGHETDAIAANARLRGACNDLALRATHAAIALFKGTSLLASHPAQRLAREAMFLLVWSCPNPVIDCTVDLLSAK